jgi:hypothetical protein
MMSKEIGTEEKYQQEKSMGGRKNKIITFHPCLGLHCFWSTCINVAGSWLVVVKVMDWGG